MKSENRKLFIELTKVVPCSLCVFCRYGEYEGGGYSLCDEGDGYYVCSHPIANLSYFNRYEEDLSIGDDCFGFNNKMSLNLLIEFVSLILIHKPEAWLYSYEKGKYEVLFSKHQDGEDRYFKATLVQ